MSSYDTTAGVHSKAAATQKQSHEDPPIVKPNVSAEAVISALSLKFHQSFCNFVRRAVYVVQVNTVSITDFGYPVFRDTYFASIFSHFIVINAP